MRRLRLSPALTLVLVLATLCVSRAQPNATPPDPFLWLEDVNGKRAMAWVRGENAKTLGVLEIDPRYAGLYAQALQIAQNKDRIPAPAFARDDVFNFWQDALHVRGVWRFTTAADYARAAPAWQTALDLDALAKAEGANWVWHGADCLWPVEERCLIALSEGGEDAETVREFDLSARRFVPGGFTLPRGKQRIAWESDRALIVAREWQPGELTASGYPYVVKRIERGAPLESAAEIFRGSASDVDVTPLALHDGDGRQALLIARSLTFFQCEYYLLTASGPRKLALPLKSEPSALFQGRLLFKLAEDWHAGGTTFAQGSLVAFDLAAAEADPAHLRPTLVYAPGPRESLEDVAATHTHLLVTGTRTCAGARSFIPRSPTAAGRGAASHFPTMLRSRSLRRTGTTSERF